MDWVAAVLVFAGVFCVYIVGLLMGRLSGRRLTEKSYAPAIEAKDEEIRVLENKIEKERALIESLDNQVKALKNVIESDRNIEQILKKMLDNRDAQISIQDKMLEAYRTQ